MHTTATSPAASRPIAAVGIFLLVSVLMIVTARWTSSGIDAAPEAPRIEQRLLRFEDAPDGSVLVRDARDSREIARVEPGHGGFLRSAVRGLVRERKRRDLDDATPFELNAHADGRLALRDPATGRHIDLASFGPDNAGAFARLLPGHPNGSTLP